MPFVDRVYRRLPFHHCIQSCNLARKHSLRVHLSSFFFSVSQMTAPECLMPSIYTSFLSHPLRASEPRLERLRNFPLFSLYVESTYGMFFFFFRTVPITFVSFFDKLMYKFRDEYQFYKYRVYPFPNICFDSSITILSEAGIWLTVSWPTYILHRLRYPNSDSHSLYNFLPNLARLVAVNSRTFSLLLHFINDSSIDTLLFESYFLSITLASR